MTTSRRSKSIGTMSNQQEPTSRRSLDSRRRFKNYKNGDYNTNMSNGSSCKVFEKRRSSSGTDVETARFPRIDGLPSSRRYPDDSPRPHLPTGNSSKNLSNSRSAYKTYTPSNYPKSPSRLEQKAGTDRDVRYETSKSESHFNIEATHSNNNHLDIQKNRNFVSEL